MATCEFSKTECYLCGEIVITDNKNTHNCISKFVEEIIKLEEKINFEKDKNVDIIDNLKVTFKDFLKNNKVSYMGTCKKCYEGLEWITRSYISGTTACQGDGCLRHYRYWCQKCKIKYCVICARPPTDGNCGCGKNQAFKELYSNSCDLCREHIEPKGYRCADCDYDICLKCFSGVPQ
jgi:hypothetical protein